MFLLYFIEVWKCFATKNTRRYVKLWYVNIINATDIRILKYTFLAMPRKKRNCACGREFYIDPLAWCNSSLNINFFSNAHVCFNDSNEATRLRNYSNHAHENQLWTQLYATRLLNVNLAFRSSAQLRLSVVRICSRTAKWRKESRIESRKQ